MSRHAAATPQTVYGYCRRAACMRYLCTWNSGGGSRSEPPGAKRAALRLNPRPALPPGAADCRPRAALRGLSSATGLRPLLARFRTVKNLRRITEVFDNVSFVARRKCSLCGTDM